MVDYVRASIRILGELYSIKGDARPQQLFKKAALLSCENGDLLVTKLVIVKMHVAKRMITEGTTIMVHGSSCRKQHVAQISMAAAIVKERHLDKDVHAHCLL